MTDHEGEIIKRKASGLPQGADDGALLVRGFPKQLVHSTAVVLAELGSPLAPLASGLSAHARALGRHACGLR
jgi:hypothetical protein